MDNIDYKELYTLQDKVLDIIFSFQNDFFLTGGTALSRFYYEKRYSDDLDFFTYNSNSFYADIKEIKQKLLQEFELNVEVETKDFVRFLVDKKLQIDFVNDRVYRYGKSKILKNGYKIDNIKNILANKLTAIMGRDNPKDIFDLYLISEFEDVDWDEILSISKEKLVYQKEELITRLQTFPITWIKNIKLIDKDFLDDFEIKYQQLIKKIAY